MNPLQLAYRWGAFVVLLLFTGLLAIKGMELWSLRRAVDGAGIGVYFLIFEINDRVLEADITNYSIGFFAASIGTAVAAIALAVNTLSKSKGRVMEA